MSKNKQQTNETRIYAHLNYIFKVLENETEKIKYLQNLKTVVDSLLVEIEDRKENEDVEYISF